jgi:hypothetical protein
MPTDPRVQIPLARAYFELKSGMPCLDTEVALEQWMGGKPYTEASLETAPAAKLRQYETTHPDVRIENPEDKEVIRQLLAVCGADTPVQH